MTLKERLQQFIEACRPRVQNLVRPQAALALTGKPSPTLRRYASCALSGYRHFLSRPAGSLLRQNHCQNVATLLTGVMPQFNTTE